MGKEDVQHVGRVCEGAPYALEPDPLPKNTTVGEDLFSFWRVLPEFI